MPAQSPWELVTSGDPRVSLQTHACPHSAFYEWTVPEAPHVTFGERHLPYVVNHSCTVLYVCVVTALISVSADRTARFLV